MTLKDYALVLLKGLAMGAADVVPGISGGTIAFITGIYQELLDSLRSINLDSARRLFSEGPLAFWRAINGPFLLALLLGIGIGIFSLAQVFTFLLEHHAVLLWAFFFGLILASAIYVARQLSWSMANAAMGIAGAVFAFSITLVTPAETTHALWFVFLSGLIAICAMLLPGISGSFILLLLGQYGFIMGAISDLNLVIIMVFGTGAAIGLLAFSHLLSWLLDRYPNSTIALLTGFMIGALNKVWPWKQVVDTYLDRHGEVKPLVEVNVLPGQFIGDPQLPWVIVLASLGFALIFVLEGMSKLLKRNEDVLASRI